MARYQRFYRHARDFSALKAAALVGLLLLTQALATVQRHHDAEEAAFDGVQIPQVMPAEFHAAEELVVRVGKMI
ncbi:hypothetical protein [Alloyangia pacifica]|uniref:Uncharacterized protein n=1 Tax=Alloyangia pacifica TaxID=311180 RepID=A0A1I6PT57_9RHOB|nr:hypothetical protein [Alloyangia pacifica]SDG35001.1 hypothetical protein SAMN04488245_102449 [Alloyangia pacifica]SFS43391.1 hypothetical protein SAMN04488050_101750 [Alloyangia pacifica]